MKRGGIAIIVALMVVMLGFAAISLDVAKLYSNAPSAEWFGFGRPDGGPQVCQERDGCNCSATAPMAADLANKNALDGLNNLSLSPSISPTARSR